MGGNNIEERGNDTYRLLEARSGYPSDPLTDCLFFSLRGTRFQVGESTTGQRRRRLVTCPYGTR